MHCSALQEQYDGQQVRGGGRKLFFREPKALPCALLKGQAADRRLLWQCEAACDELQPCMSLVTGRLPTLHAWPNAGLLTLVGRLATIMAPTCTFIFFLCSVSIPITNGRFNLGTWQVGGATGHFAMKMAGVLPGAPHPGSWREGRPALRCPHSRTAGRAAGGTAQAAGSVCLLAVGGRARQPARGGWRACWRAGELMPTCSITREGPPARLQLLTGAAADVMLWLSPSCSDACTPCAAPVVRACLQGIWLCEHRDHGGRRRVVVTIQGES